MKIILGGGVTGVISSYYNPEYKIVSRDVGQDSNRFGPRILKSTDCVELFLERMDLVLKKRNYKCAYISGGKLKEKLSGKEVGKYLEKTRGKEWKSFSNSGLNEGNINVVGYDMVDFYRIIKDSIFIQDRWNNFNISKIDVKNKEIYFSRFKEPYKYEKIINTLPCNVFNRLIGKKTKTSNSEIFLYLVKIDDPIFNTAFKIYDFIYYIDEDVPQYRITKIDEGYYCIESMKKFKPQKESSFPDIHQDWEEHKLPYGKIVDSVKPEEVEDIEHVGRYAKNRQDERLHTVIEYWEGENV